MLGQSLFPPERQLSYFRTAFLYLLNPNEVHFSCVLASFYPSSILWKTFPLLPNSILYFISLMKYIFHVSKNHFVLHWPYERHFPCFRKAFCTSSPWWSTFSMWTSIILSFILRFSVMFCTSPHNGHKRRPDFTGPPLKNPICFSVSGFLTSAHYRKICVSFSTFLSCLGRYRCR